MGRWVLAMLAAASIFALSAEPSRAAECKLQMFAAKTVRSSTGMILIEAMIGDKPMKFMLDTGSVWSTIRQGDVGAQRTIAGGVLAYGAAGETMRTSVHFPTMKIGPGEIKDQIFLVVPDQAAGLDHVDGVLGADFLTRFDLELDISNNIVNFFLPSSCGERSVYWPNNGFVTIPMSETAYGQIHFLIDLNGKPLRGLLDTGAASSVLSLEAADGVFGLTRSSPGVEEAGNMSSISGRTIPSLMHQFELMEFGGLKFRNPWLRLSKFPNIGAYENQLQLILGMHQLRQLHLYISYKDRTIYATASGSSGGAKKENALAVRQLDSIDMKMIAPFMDGARKHMADKEPDLALADADEIIKRYPGAPLGYLKRGQIEVQAGRLDAAVTDFGRAIDADPDFSPAYEGRARVLRQLRHDDQAATDDAKAVELSPKAPEDYVARAVLRSSYGDVEGALVDYGKQIELRPGAAGPYAQRAAFFADLKDYARAQTDLDHAVAIEPKNDYLYLRRAIVKGNQHHYQSAIEDADIALRLDPKSSAARNSLCWYHAILGQLDLALPDCDQAIDGSPKSAAAWNSRAFVRLKQARFSDAIDDYSDALALNPNEASSLYGRGLAKQAMGDAKGGSADILAAQKLQPDIADQFGK